jgi:hypothetical protein
MGCGQQSLLTVNSAGGFGPETQFVVSSSGGSLFNDATGCIGCEFTVGGSNIQVTQLARIKISGNSQTHLLRLVRSSDNATLASVTVDLSTGVAGDWIYGSVTPTVLTAGQNYMVTTKETNGGDQFRWDDGQTTTTTAVATIIGSVTSTGATCTSYITNSVGVKDLGLVNFKYQVAL